MRQVYKERAQLLLDGMDAGRERHREFGDCARRYRPVLPLRGVRVKEEEEDEEEEEAEAQVDELDSIPSPIANPPPRTLSTSSSAVADNTMHVAVEDSGVVELAGATQNNPIPATSLRRPLSTTPCAAINSASSPIQPKGTREAEEQPDVARSGVTPNAAPRISLTSSSPAEPNAPPPLPLASVNNGASIFTGASRNNTTPIPEAVPRETSTILAAAIAVTNESPLHPAVGNSEAEEVATVTRTEIIAELKRISNQLTALSARIAAGGGGVLFENEAIR